MGIYAIVAVIAYLLGSIPFGYILLRVFRGEDVRQHGSGNIGATNVARKAPGLGIATLLLDAAKGYAAVVIAWRLAELRARGIAPEPTSIYICIGLAAMFALIGHIFPVWLKFKGGKGVATGVGVFVGIMPQAVLIVLAVFALMFAAFRYVSLASIVATAAFPVVAYALMSHQDRSLMPFMVAAAALIIVKHHQNIRRLLAGTEHRFELKHR